MLISTGKVPSREPWRILEVSIGQQPDVLALRISKELRRFHEPAEALIPFTPTAQGLADWIIPHIYVRGLNGSLSKLARTPGIEFIRTELADAAWIRQLQQTDSAPIRKDSFVRVLTGPCARMCGHVQKLDGEHATVTIALRTKRILVHTLVTNVQSVECPPEQQTFYYSA